MTDQEKQELFDELLQQIKSESQDIAALEEVSSLTGVKSLPAMRGTQLVTAPISLLSQAAMEGASLTLDLAELDAITSALKAERAYGKPALCGFIKQGDITIGTFACYASGGNTGYVQRLMSNYIINADGTITGSEIATSGRKQTHIAERVYSGGAWTLWREIVSAHEDCDKYYKPTRIEKIADYAYHIWYGGVDYADAAEYFKGNYEATVGACSAIWKDGILYRNYDWYYSNNAGFFVHTPAVNGRHAVNGFAGYLKGLTMAVVDSGEWNDKYRILPYLMTDGMNDAGLSAAVLVCENKDVTPTAQNTGKKKMNGLFVVRYVLDNHTDALEAAQDIANNYDVYMPHTDSVDEELHFIIGDKEKCVILEFVDNETKIITDRNFVTNFKLYNTLSNADGTIKYNTVRPYGQGVERYNQIARIYDMAPGVSLLATLKYTNAYQGDIEGAWRTEFTGINDNLTVPAAFVEPERYSQILAAARTAFLARTRSEEKTWQTCHSVVFDSNTKKINFFVQEDHHHVWTYDTTSPIDELGKKIGNLGNLTTPKKSDLVSAINCVYETVVITADLLWAATSTGLPSPKSIPVQQIYEVASADGNRGKMVKVVANDNSGRYITCMVNLIAKPNEYNIFAFVPYSDTPVIYKLHYAPGFPTRSPEVINLANSVNKVNLSDSTSTGGWPNMTVAEFGEVLEKSGIYYDTLYPVVVTWRSQNKVYIVQSVLSATTSVVRLLDINTMEMYDYALDSKTQTVAKTYVNRLANLSDVSSYFQKMAAVIIGDVSTLNTTEKSVVPAINEVFGEISNKSMVEKPVIFGRCIPRHAQAGSRYYFREMVKVKGVEASELVIERPTYWEDINSDNIIWATFYKINFPVIVTIPKDFDYERFLTDVEYRVSLCKGTNGNIDNTAASFWRIVNGYPTFCKIVSLGEIIIEELENLKSKYYLYEARNKYRRKLGVTPIYAIKKTNRVISKLPRLICATSSRCRKNKCVDKDIYIIAKKRSIMLTKVYFKYNGRHTTPVIQK